MYATNDNSATEIDLRDLRTGRVRTLVSFPGEVKVLGLDLGAGKLAWAQQRQSLVGHSEITPTGGERSECQTVALEKPQLVTLSLSSIPPGGLTDGPPLPPFDERACMER